MLNVSDRPSSPHTNPHPNLQADSQSGDAQANTQLGSDLASQGSRASLGVWLNSVLRHFLSNTPQIRQRGNVVYVLCEGSPCPAQQDLTDALKRSIVATPFIDRHLSPKAAPVHRIVLYGRTTGDSKPAWGETFELPAAETSLQPQNPDGSQIASPQIASPQSASSQFASPQSKTSEFKPSQVEASQPRTKRKNLSNEGIAHHLSRQLSPYNIAVRVRRKLTPAAANTNAAADRSSTLSRLYIVCESTYAPDPNVIAEPLAHCLRELALRDCQDAVISGQATGESEPEWMLRVDLTPADRLLQQRAKWGDIEALKRLLTPTLRSFCQAVHITLEQTTLHIAARNTDSCPPQSLLVQAIDGFLSELAPQGIHGASLYGIVNPDGAPETTQWVHWLDLPAAHQVELTASPEELAARGNPDAIAHLLLRQLNPNLDQQLATGGLRVQVRQREDVLHIMTDALICPNQKTVSAVILHYLPSLNIDGLSGLCLYGRQAGNTTATWRQGVQLGKLKNRFVPASSPEFTASDRYVEDLLPMPGAIVFMPRRAPKDWGKTWGKVTEGVRSVLLKTPLFAPLSANPRLIPIRDERVSGQVALVWGLLGLCLMISGDWALGFVIKTQGITSATSQTIDRSVIAPPTALPNLALNKPGISSDASAFNASGFTQNEKARVVTSGASSSAKSSLLKGGVAKSNAGAFPADLNADANLPVSPLMPKAQIDPTASPYSSLNAPQLDERLALYQQHVAQFGVPDVLVVGSSRALRGVDPSALQESLTQQGYAGMRVFNFGINGATAQVVDLLLRRLIPAEQLPKTILWADGARAFNSGRSDATFNAIASSDGYKRLPASPINKLALSKSSGKSTGKSTDKATDKANEASPQSLQKALSDSYQSVDRQIQDWLKSTSSVGHQRDVLFGLMRDRFLGQQTSGVEPNAGPNATPSLNANSSLASASPTGQGVIDIYGFLPLPNQFNPATYYQKYSKVPGTFDSDYDSFELQGKQQQALDSIAQFTRNQGIALVFVNLPLTAEYLDPRRREYEDQFQQSMIQESTTLKFTYRDLSTVMPQQNALFSDPSHLNRYGAYDVAQRLSRDPLIPWSGEKSGEKSSKSLKK